MIRFSVLVGALLLAGCVAEPGSYQSIAPAANVLGQQAAAFCPLGSSCQSTGGFAGEQVIAQRNGQVYIQERFDTWVYGGSPQRERSHDRRVDRRERHDDRPRYHEDAQPCFYVYDQYGRQICRIVR